MIDFYFLNALGLIAQLAHHSEWSHSMSTYARVSLSDTEARTLHSTIVDQEFQISVALPWEYSAHPGKKYPVIYVLDAHMHFGMVTQILRQMSVEVPFCHQVPHAIIVGIGYPEAGPAGDNFA